jgi:hypothetical protein
MTLHPLQECPKPGGSGMLGGVESEPGPTQGRGREIDARLDAVRTRIKQLKERDLGANKRWVNTPSERVAAARRHAAEAYAAATEVLASSVETFRYAAEAHERSAGMHDRTAAAGIGDVGGHERQAALHRAAAAADLRRAERVQSRLSDHERTQPGPISEEPRDGVVR